MERDRGVEATCSCNNDPQCYIIVHNVAKKHNIGTLARSAAAFGTAQICLVGSRHYNTFGSHGSAAHIPVAHFVSLGECCTWLRQEKGCKVVGVEITHDAKAVHTHPFEGSTAFMIGNEGTGLSDKQIKLCDSFVYIPQHGMGTASLNVTVATSIVLHHFAIWAGYQEATRHGFKFDVAEPPQRTAPRGQVPLSSSDIEALRDSRQTAHAQDWLMGGEAKQSQGGADGLLDAMFEESDS